MPFMNRQRRILAIHLPAICCIVAVTILTANIANSASPSPSAKFDLQQRKKTQWAWQPILQAIPPSVQYEAWVQTPIDRFILAKLEENHLHPAGSADRRTLIRRAYFDLIGLPPPAEAIEAFLADSSPDAFAKVVDGLLASPHFGERWARHWMDLARYAETYGHEFDYPIENAWRYRDYLTRAFNSDLPYDQFVLEQVAGDLLPDPRLNRDDRVNESIVGTGFWWLGEQTHSPVDVRQHQADWLDNQIDVFGKTFLGMTINCARCHDHKFDPIAQKDYYGLMGILESSRRLDAMLDPHGSIESLNSAIAAIRQQADALLVDGLPAPDDKFKSAIAKSLLESSSKINDDAHRRISSPFWAWTQLGTVDGDEFEAVRQHAVTELDVERQRADESRNGSTLFKSFSDGSYDNWFATGWAFGNHPTQIAQWDPMQTGTHVLPPGVARSDTNGEKLNGVLCSPTFTLTRPEILYHLAGHHCQVRLIIDGYRMDTFNGLLFGGASFNIDTGGKFAWIRQAQDVSRYVGEQAHIEFIDQGDGWIAIDEIRFADKGAAIPIDPPSGTSIAILQDATVTSRQTLATAYAGRICAAIARWKSAKRANIPDNDPDSQLLTCAINQGLVEISPQARTTLEQLKARFDQLTQEIPQPQLALAMADGTGIDEHVFIRGNHKTLGEIAPRGFLSAIDGPNQPRIQHGSGRLELARRMIDSSDPLLARVMVNRIWHHLLGRGIVASTDNVGLMGSLPSHPELLDYLASQFKGDGWSIKKTIRAIMLSRVYQMASHADDAAAEQADPDNLLLHRANVRRLEAEPIRDAILSVSGRLNSEIGGPSVNVFLTPFMEGRGRPPNGPLDGDGRRRRYLAERRNFLSPMMLAFDQPTPFGAMGRRSISNVPAQALILMNDPFVLEQANLWARQTLAKANLSSRQRVDAMYIAAFSRPASDSEFEKIEAFMSRQAEALSIPPDRRDLDVRIWTDVAHALFNAKEFIFLN